MIRTDDLGEYDDEVLPDGFVLPLRVDQDNLAIVFDDNVILARYGATIETAVLLQEQRKAEFLCRLANGEIVVRRDKKGIDHVFKRESQLLRNGKLTIEYEELKQPVLA